jgi:hypothetical protein
MERNKGDVMESKGNRVARHQEFDVLQRALQDPWMESENGTRSGRRPGKVVARWLDQAAERMKAAREREEPHGRRALA